MARVAVILLAAGGSRRLGSPKQLIDVAGRPMIRVITDQLRQLHPAHLAVVVGSNSESITQALSDVDANLITNPAWQQGIGTSIAAGVRWAQTQDVDAALIALCDQPTIPTSHYANLIAALADEIDAVASTYDGAPGVPAVFQKRLFDSLETLQGDRGAKAILMDPSLRIRQLACPAARVDMDTPADVERFRRSSDDR